MTSKQTKSAVLSLTFILFSLAANSGSLLSNFNSTVDGGYGGAPDAGNPISTGTTPLEIGSISVRWEFVTGTPGFNAVGIYEDDSGVPSNVPVGSLFTNPDPTSVGKMRYVGNAVLSPNTQYWVVLDINDGSNPAFTFTNVVTTDVSTGGATIPDRSVFGSISTNEWNDDPASLFIELDDLIFANGFD